jgi:hypothetical protein
MACTIRADLTDNVSNNFKRNFGYRLLNLGSPETVHAKLRRG